MADWIEERIAKILDDETWVVGADEARDDAEFRLLQLSRQLNLEQRFDLLRSMYSILGEEASSDART